VATLIVAGGPRLVALADRVAVPLLLVVGAVMTVAVLRLPMSALDVPGTGEMPWLRGLDIVVGYQVSWILMFADFSRYTPSARRAAGAVLLGLLTTSLWMMPLGFAAATAAGSADPGAMMQALRLGAWGAVLLTVATITTNFVNIYMSALAIRSLCPRVGAQASVWSTGLVGAALSLFSGGWLEHYANFMLVLGGVLVPVGGVLLARFFLLRRRWPVHVPELYDAAGPYARRGGFSVAGLTGWAAGAAAYYGAAAIGGTLPSLGVAVGVYWWMETGGGKAGSPGAGRGEVGSMK
jgi:purine-cytosine permease-like protein